MQTVTFGGYTVSVPASWPVYDLTKNPRQCVRYDVHAVYLGTPGPDPDCPPNLVGRVDTAASTRARPSLPTMKAWRAKYAATAIYIQGGRDLAEHRRRLGGQRGRAEVAGGSPIRTSRIQFAMTGPDS